MSTPHNYTVIGAIMNSMVGGDAPQGSPTIVSVVGPEHVDEGSPATITVTTQNFPDGDTTLNWAITQNASDFEVSSGTVVISAGTVSTVYEVVSGATVTIDDDESGGDNFYTYTFGGTLSGNGAGFGYPVLLNERIGSSQYYRGASTGSVGEYLVTRKVTTGGNGIKSFTVTPELDGVTEGDEQFTVTVSGTVDSTPVTRTSAPITINDVVGATSIPSGTITARDSSTNNYAASCRNEATSESGESVFPYAYLTARIYASPISLQSPNKAALVSVTGDPPFSDRSGNANIMTWWDTNQQAQAFSLDSDRNVVPQIIYVGSNTPDISAVKIIYRIQGSSSSVDLGWTSTPNAQDGRSATFSASASAGAGADDFEGRTYEVEFWGRASGYNDTKLATFLLRVEAYADGANF